MFSQKVVHNQWCCSFLVQLQQGCASSQQVWSLGVLVILRELSGRFKVCQGFCTCGEWRQKCRRCESSRQSRRTLIPSFNTPKSSGPQTTNSARFISSPLGQCLVNVGVKTGATSAPKFALIIATCIFCQYTEPSDKFEPGVLSATNGKFSHNFVIVTLLRAFQLFTCVRDSDNASVHRKHTAARRGAKFPNEINPPRKVC